MTLGGSVDYCGRFVSIQLKFVGMKPILHMTDTIGQIVKAAMFVCNFNIQLSVVSVFMVLHGSVDVDNTSDWGNVESCRRYRVYRRPRTLPWARPTVHGSDGTWAECA